MKQSYFAFLLAALLFAPLAASAQCLSAWGYYQPITITNTLPQTLTNFQVKVTVNTAAPIAAGHMLSNGNDIRFTFAGCNNVNYWIESGINTSATVIWLKVPSLTASGNSTVNMYYGNPAAPAVSNGDSVFLFFDDFNGPSLDLVKWTVRGTPSVLTTSGGILEIQGNGNWEYIRSNTTWNGAVVIESNESTTIQPSAAMVLGYAGTDSRYTFRANGANKGVTYDPDVSGGNAWFDMNYPNVPHPANVYNKFELQTDFVGSNIVVNSFCNISTANCNTVPTALNTVTGTGYYVGFSSYSGSYVEYVDWIKVRSFASQQPTSSNGTEQVNAGITTALSSASFCVGAALNVDFTPSGTFVAGNVFTAELSDALGSFAAPTPIGTLSSVSTSPQTIAGTIPSSTPSGNQYRIRVTSSNQALTGNDNGTDLTVNPLPNITATVYTTAICNGMSDTIVAGGGLIYSWNTGPTTVMIIVSPATTSTYIVAGVDLNGCVNYDTAIVMVNPLPIVDATSTTGSICAGETELIGVTGANAYLWNTGDTISSLTVSPSVTTTYSVTGTDMNGCSAIDSVTVIVNQLPVIAVSSATDSACNTDGLIALTSVPAGGTWSGPGVTGSDLDPTLANIGTNSAVYSFTDGFGCSASDSVSVYIDVCLGIQSAIAAEELQLFPNPNSGAFTITSEDVIGVFEITDVAGRVLYTGVSQNRTETLNVEGLANGIYFVKTVNAVTKFVVE